MNDPNVIAAAVVIVLAAIGTLVVQIINAVSASKDRREAARERLEQLTLAKAAAVMSAAVNSKADALIEGTAKIHELTNSTNSQLQKALEVMTERFTAQAALVARLVEEKRETAATRAVTDLQREAALATPVPVGTRRAGDLATLAQIEINTKETVKTLKDRALAALEPAGDDTAASLKTDASR